MKTLAFQHYAHFVTKGELYIWVGGKQSFSDEEWSGYMRELRASFSHHGNSYECLPHLVVSEGAMPSLSQRAELIELDQQKVDKNSKALTAIVTSSLMVRGPMTALGWFNPGLRAFPPNRLAAALAHLGVNSIHRAAITKEIARLYRELGDVGTASRWAEQADSV